MKLSIDKLSFTGKIKYEDLLESTLRRMGCRVVMNPTYNYKYTGFMSQSDDSKAVIQWGGTQENIKGKYRIEFNPNKLSWQVEKVLSLMPKINMDYDRVTITRIDLAVDIFEPYENFEFLYKYGVKRRLYLGRNSLLESIYFGSNSSERMYRCYNKAKEQNVDRAWTRIELQLRKDIKLKDIQEYMFYDAFDELQVVRTSVQDNFIKVPLEYRALMWYLKDNPQYEGELGRVKKENLNIYRKAERKEFSLSKELLENVERLLDEMRDLLRGKSEKFIKEYNDFAMNVLNKKADFYKSTVDIEKEGVLFRV